MLGVHVYVIISNNTRIKTNYKPLKIESRGLPKGSEAFIDEALNLSLTERNVLAGR